MVDQNKMKPMQVEGQEGELEAAQSKRRKVMGFVAGAVVLFGSLYLLVGANETPFLRGDKGSKQGSEQTTFLDKHKFEGGTREVEKLQVMLEDYYTGVNVLNQGFSSLPGSTAWNAATKYTAEKMVRVLLQDRPLKIGVIGSSVAAGHDNCNYDSFERQLERTLMPIWKAFGSSIIVENAGEGGQCGDSHENQIFCWESLVGDVDILVYSWSYFEQDDWWKEHEAIARWTLVSDSAPVVNTLYTDGSGDPAGSCRQIPRRDMPVEPPTVEEYYSKYGFMSFCLDMTLKFIPGYKGKQPNGVGDGLHNTTRYAGTEMNGKRTESLGVVWRNWHPGPLGFQLASDMYAYYYAGILKQALEIISNTPGDELLERFAKAGSQGLKKEDLPKALFCEEKHRCTLSKPPQCTSFELPQYGRRQIQLVAAVDPEGPFALEEYLPFKEESKQMEHLIPREESDLEKCQHLDSCGWVTPNDPMKGGTLLIKLPELDAGAVAICFFLGGQEIQDFVEQDGVEISLDGVVLDKQNFRLEYPNKKCLQLWPEGTLKERSDHKAHYVGVKVTKRLGIPAKISQIMAW